MPVPILAAVRSPFAVADGVLAGWHPVDLAAEIARHALDRAGLGASDIDHVWVGCDEPVGAQGANAARAVVLAAGWPESIAATVVEASPHGGMSALASACDAVAVGRVRTAVVIGMSSASIVQPGASALGRTYGRPWGDAPAARYADQGGLVPPVVAADRAAVMAGIDRPTQDAWGLRSLAGRVAPAGAVLSVPARPGAGAAVQKGTPITEDVRRVIPSDSLEPIFDAEGTTTAAGFAPAADGVSVLVVGDPGATGGGTVGVIERVAVTAGSPFDPAAAVMSIERPDVDRLTLAASSASMALVALQAMGVVDHDDPLGGTIAVGDAAAAEDLRLIVDGVHQSAPGERWHGLRVGSGAAAGCVFRRP